MAYSCRNSSGLSPDSLAQMVFATDTLRHPLLPNPAAKLRKVESRTKKNPFFLFLPRRSNFNHRLKLRISERKTKFIWVFPSCGASLGQHILARVGNLLVKFRHMAASHGVSCAMRYWRDAEATPTPYCKMQNAKCKRRRSPLPVPCPPSGCALTNRLNA